MTEQKDKNRRRIADAERKLKRISNEHKLMMTQLREMDGSISMLMKTMDQNTAVFKEHIEYLMNRWIQFDEMLAKREETK